MKKVLKWIGIGITGLLGIIMITAVILSFAGGSRLQTTREIRGETISIPSDETSLARGAHLVNVACKSCHGPGLSGQPVLADPAIGTIYAANITGLAASHTDEEIVRAIRHAVDTDGRQLIIMPAESFIYFSEEDLGSVIAYLKQQPRVENEIPAPELAFMGRVLLGAGLFGNVFPAEYIDHGLPFPARPEIGASAAYGEYVSRFCTSCHGPDLAGAQPSDPTSPPAPNLTPGGALGEWTEADFLSFMRSGVTPSGRQLDAAFMPWESFGKFDNAELQGLWLYLQSLPPALVEADGR